jgi:hypothetical protein
VKEKEALDLFSGPERKDQISLACQERRKITGKMNA